MSGDVSARSDAELSLERALQALDAAEFKLASASAEVARLEKACLYLFTEKLLVNRGDALRPDYRELDAPVIELRFRYPGFTVACDDDRASFARDHEAETRARHTLESFGAIELELLEDYGTAPGSRAHYLVQTDETRDGQCAFSAYALPQLRALGFEVRVADDYPYRVLSDEPPWYAEVAEAERPDWFSLELGIEIDGVRINLLPVLLRMLEEGWRLARAPA